MKNFILVDLKRLLPIHQSQQNKSNLLQYHQIIGNTIEIKNTLFYLNRKAKANQPMCISHALFYTN